MLRRARPSVLRHPAEVSTSGWLADDIVEAFSVVPGSFEREHVLALLRRARRVRLDEQTTSAVAATVRNAIWSIERHAGAVDPGLAPLWIEYDHAPRLAVYERAVDGAPITVGCLLASDPGAPDHVAIFVAWSVAVPEGAPPGTLRGPAHHSYALLHWDLAAFAAAGSAAPERADGLSEERLMGLTRTSVPPGLLSELEIWQDIKAANDPRLDAAVVRTQRDALGEHLFLMSALLMLGSTAVEVVPAEVDGIGDETPDRWEARLVPGAGDPPWPWTRSGFRVQLLGGPLAWSTPAA